MIGNYGKLNGNNLHIFKSIITQVTSLNYNSQLQVSLFPSIHLFSATVLYIETISQTTCGESFTSNLFVQRNHGCE